MSARYTVAAETLIYDLIAELRDLGADARKVAEYTARLFALRLEDQ